VVVERRGDGPGVCTHAVDMTTPVDRDTTRRDQWNARDGEGIAMPFCERLASVADFAARNRRAMRFHGPLTSRETESTRQLSRFDRHDVVAQAMQPSRSESTSRGRAIMRWRFACAMALTGAFATGPALAQTTPGKAPTPALPGSTPPNSQPGTLPGSPPPPSMPQSGIPARPQGPTDTLGNPQSPTGPGPMAPCPPGTLSQPCIPGAGSSPMGKGQPGLPGTPPPPVQR